MSDSHTASAVTATVLPFVQPAALVGVVGASVAAAALATGEGLADVGQYAVVGAGGLGLYVFNRLASVLESLLAIVRLYVTAHTEGKLPPLRIEISHHGRVATGDDDDVELEPGGRS